MDTRVKAGWQLPATLEIQDILERMKHNVRYAAAVIASCREAQTRRRIRVYFDARLLEELAEAGDKIANNDILDP